MKNAVFVVSLLLLLLSLAACEDPVVPVAGSEGEWEFPTPVVVSPSLTFSTIAATGHHTCAVGIEGETYCWGSNEFGELGSPVVVDECAHYYFGERPCTSIPTLVASPLRFESLTGAMNGGRTCGLTAVGEAHCWGFGRDGQLGDGSRTDRTGPVAVAGGLRFQELISGHTDRSLTCGRTEEGYTYCWGVNENLNGTGERNSIETIPMRMGGKMSFTSFDVGLHHVCALTADGYAYCWGDNWFGQLGVGSEGGEGGLEESANPLPVDTDLRFRSIVAGSYHSCALTHAGSAHCWGSNLFVGSQGDPPVASPRAVAGGHSFVSLHAALQHTCGLTEGGNAYCWGWNWKGDLGDGTHTHRRTPTRVAMDFPFSTLSHRPYCGLAVDGSAYCWGDNSYSQVGQPIPRRINP